MFSLDEELAEEYLAESRDHLASIDVDLSAIENGCAVTESAFVERMFRSLHALKVGAGFFDLWTIRDLANETEQTVALIRSGKLTPTAECIRVLRQATNRLDDLIRAVDRGNRADATGTVTALHRLRSGGNLDGGPHGVRASGVVPARDGPLRILLVEDDFSSRLLLQTFLSRYGECHIAVNGREAVDAFRAALEEGRRYDLICMDFMMPEIDGCEALRQVRAIEEGAGIISTYGAKIVMTTCVDEIKEVSRCFGELCDAYLRKPIDLSALLSQMRFYRLVE